MQGAGRDPSQGLSISRQAWQAIAYTLELAPRELEVLQGVVDDRHEHDIAAALGLSRHTIRTYLKRLRAKLGASSRVRMVERVFAENYAWLARSAPS